MTKIQKMTDLFTRYKKTCAKIIRTGKTKTMTLFSDSANILDDDFNCKVIESAKTATSSEELLINQVNFIFSLLNKSSKEIIFNDFILCCNPLWWNRKYSRSTYYRNKTKAIDKFLSYYETIDQV